MSRFLGLFPLLLALLVGCTEGQKSNLARRDLNPAKPANLVTVYSNLKADPSGIYQAQAPEGPWNKLPQSQPGQPFTIVAKTSTFGSLWRDHQ